ncbi:pyridoxamine 5'-phosphate oxidase family protein [Micromonospora sagamiensis]|uniref:Pyridoxamine 5'-phosphate oxidase n=1 Tax=Micromonospora sagamiensis TaxID=47875 RepID=A0A562WK59_9ACTN|nr:pyridoxamine 5'-phosphate oxidase family protein [Micromonospora sagamiensis]TWJ30690.1 pyridoxamine 5'-phosphate oxidase [Micromonospora sagamiensis]BCL16277.1 pyridoxamine 5'-phosphate oxidase [Micromonospora sagamiensis]
MGKVYPEIDGRLRTFIEAQPVFFVATAPTSVDGHINLSPKGMRGTFVVLGPHRVAYLDYHGSGAETIAHLRDNGRITLMFCAFAGPPKVVRLHGRGDTVAVGTPDFAARLAGFPDPPDLHAVRAVVTVEVDRVSDSCGFSVPLMEYQGDRDMLLANHSRRTTEDLVVYRATKNAASIDGLPVF